jgi:hypothetical protein
MLHERFTGRQTVSLATASRLFESTHRHDFRPFRCEIRRVEGTSPPTVEGLRKTGGLPLVNDTSIHMFLIRGSCAPKPPVGSLNCTVSLGESSGRTSREAEPGPKHQETCAWRVSHHLPKTRRRAHRYEEASIHLFTLHPATGDPALDGGRATQPGLTQSTLPRIPRISLTISVGCLKPLRGVIYEVARWAHARRKTRCSISPGEGKPAPSASDGQT